MSDASLLELPIRSADSINAKLSKYGNTQFGEPVPNLTLRKVEQKRNTYKDPHSGLNILEIVADNGEKRFHDSGVAMGSTALTRFSVGDNDPLSAKAEYEWVWEFSRENWQTKTKTNTTIRSEER